MKREAKQTPNDRHGDFVFTKVVVLDELASTLYELTHEPTGARVMHIENDDRENLFSLSFQTLPTCSDGAPHILEHVVLCGSKKFPVKDPFFSMNRRSLNTFMNAMTGSDFTCYPASSQVEQDFYNLLEVYLDAVFYPTINPLSFLQEGHRLELKDPNDLKSPLMHKGIVFNEMKGAMSSPDSRLWHTMLEKIVPDLPYRFNSGGEPKVIPTLSYENLKKFHEFHYHPGHCLFFFYGNLPLTQHLDFIQKHALEGVKPGPPLLKIPKQKRFEKPLEYTFSYPELAEDLTKKTYVGFGFLTTDAKHQHDLLALTILDSVLMDTDASPLKRRLLASKKCAYVDAYIDTEMSEVPYFIVFRGTEEKYTQELEELLFQSLQEIVEEGLNPKLIEAAIHQIEISRLEITSQGGPYGLTLFMRAALTKQHGGNAENALAVYGHFDRLLKVAEDPNYFPNLIRKYYIDNPHRTRVIMKPDNTLEEKERLEEEKELEAKKASLREEELKEIQKQMSELKAYQARSDADKIHLLPKIHVKDAPKKARYIPLNTSEHGALKIHHHSCFTNHILYADLTFDLPDFLQEELSRLQLLTSIMTVLGCGSRGYLENLDFMNAHIGVMTTYLALHPHIESPNSCQPCFGIRGKALFRNRKHLFSLMKDFLLKPNLSETERIKELIEQSHNSKEHRITRSAMGYATQLSLRRFNKVAAVRSIWYGIPALQLLREVTSDIDRNLPKLIEEFHQLKEKLLTFANPQLVLSCDEKIFEALQKEKFYDLDTLPKKPHTPWNPEITLEDIPSQFREISSPVAFTSQAFETITITHPDAPYLSLASLLLDHLGLHQKIREQGGAYGSGATYRPVAGLFNFNAYRDPNLDATLQAFRDSAQEIADGMFSENDLEEAVLSLLQGYDQPISPGFRASAAFSSEREGKTLEFRQAYRDKIMTAKKEDIIKAVKNHILSKMDNSVTVTFSGKDLIDRESKLLAARGIKMDKYSI